MKKLESKFNQYRNNELRNDLFNKMTQLQDVDKTMLLCRLFGLMETYELEDKSLTSSTFFTMIESKLNK